MEKPYQILIADDHPLVLEGVKASLQQTPEYQVVGKSRRPDETLDLVAALRPQLLILDIVMGKECSLDWLERFHSACPEMKILILSALQTGNQLRQAIHPAVAGFVLKGEANDFLLQAIRIVASGGSWFSTGISGELRRLAESEHQDVYRLLTARERQVLALLKMAKTNGSIAAELNLSVHSVRRYVTTIYQKLGVSNRGQAALQR